MYTFNSLREALITSGVIKINNSESAKSLLLENNKKYKNIHAFTNNVLKEEINSIKKDLKVKSNFFKTYYDSNNSKSSSTITSTPQTSRLVLVINSKSVTKEKKTISKLQIEPLKAKNVTSFYSNSKTKINDIDTQRTSNSKPENFTKSDIKTIILHSEENSIKTSQINILKLIRTHTAKPQAVLSRRQSLAIQQHIASSNEKNLKKSTTVNYLYKNINKKIKHKRGLTNSKSRSPSKSPTKTLSFDANESFIFHENLKEKQRKEKEVDLVYKKMFDKQLNKNLLTYKTMNNKDIDIDPKKMKNFKIKRSPEYIKEKIKDIKSKILFMKGVFDYAYPLITVKKIKAQQMLFDKLISDYNNKQIIQNDFVRLKTKYQTGTVYKIKTNLKFTQDVIDTVNLNAINMTPKNKQIFKNDTLKKIKVLKTVQIK